MKNLLKISLMFSFLFIASSALKAQSCNGVGISMSVVSAYETPLYYVHTVRVTTSAEVEKIRVGSRTCQSGVNSCTGSFMTFKTSGGFDRTLKCFVLEDVGCSQREDGCIVVISGND